MLQDLGERTQIANSVIPKNVMFVPKSHKAPLMREAVPTASLAHGAGGASEQQDWHRIDPKQEKSWCYRADQEWK